MFESASRTNFGKKVKSSLRHRMGTKIFLSMLIALMFAGTKYYVYLTSTIEAESETHLIEIYHQADKTLHSILTRNWDNLHMWAPYLMQTGDYNRIDEYISGIKEETGFTDFYFITRDGNYRTIDGNVGYFDLKEQFSELIIDKKDVVVTSMSSSRLQVFLFVSPVDKSRYRDFEYEAIAVSYNNTDLMNSLEMSAFDNSSIAYIVRPDGCVVAEEEYKSRFKVYNMLAMLREYSDLSEEEICRLQDDFKQKKTGALQFSVNKVRYYLVYESVAFEDWIVVGIVPAAVVNASINKLQTSTLVVVLLISLTVLFSLLYIIVQSNKHKLDEKDSELLYREQLFSVLSSNVDDVFLMLDQNDLHVDYVSPNVKRLFGISEAKVRKDIHCLDRLVRREEDGYILNFVSDMTDTMQKEWDREYFHQITGDVMWVHVIVICREIRGQKKFIFVFSDRTKDKKLNQELSDAVDIARNANNAKSIFLSNMSHDIRTPMSAVIGFATLALADIENMDKVKDYLNKILSSGNHLLGLINNILDMSRIESGKVSLEEKETNLMELFRDIKTIISAQLYSKKLEMYMDITDIKDKDVYCDKTRFNQVLLNLMSNAIKFSLPEGTIFVRLTQLENTDDSRGRYEIRIKDNGIGMSREFAEKVFEPFERERSSTVSRIQGTGLGMAISKNIIDMMGGTIDVITEQGKGTEFIICVKLRLVPKQIKTDVREEKKEKAVMPLADKFSGFENKRLLLVEDNDYNREIAGEILKAYGFNVDLAENGLVAFEKIKSAKAHEYDIILMDLQMPVMDGYESTKAIRELEDDDKKNIPIVAMTANAFEEDKKKVLSAGMNGHLTKPIEIQKLLEELKRILL